MNMLPAVSQGSLTASSIASQISALNSQYSGLVISHRHVVEVGLIPFSLYLSYGFSFTLAATDYTTNADWFSNAGPDTSQQTAMKNSLRKGGAADLNLCESWRLDLALPGTDLATRQTRSVSRVEAAPDYWATQPSRVLTRAPPDRKSVV